MKGRRTRKAGEVRKQSKPRRHAKPRHFKSKLSQGDKPSSKPFLRQGAIKGRQVRTDKPTTERNRASKAVVVAEKKSLSQKTTFGKDSFHKTTLSDNKQSGGGRKVKLWEGSPSKRVHTQHTL
jgi:hypothetical protein